MGMSPSCHCLCPGTGGVGSSSQGPDTIRCGAQNLLVARRYAITVAHPTTDPAYACCCGEYTGERIVYNIPGLCTYSSIETLLCCKRDSGGNSCLSLSTGIARFALIISSFGSQVRYETVMGYETKNLPASKQDHQVRWRGTAATALTSATIAYLSHVANLTGTDCGGDLSYGGPCANGNSFPSVYVGTTCFVRPLL